MEVYHPYNSIALIARSLEPVDCKHLQRSAATECERKEAEIMNTWFPLIIHILTDAETLEGLKVEQLDSFYNCASTLMSNQVKQKTLYT